MINEVCERRRAIYADYLDVICPFVVQLEVMDSEYPIEIFNEIRAITTHMARIDMPGQSDEDIEYNLRGAESHIKRAILDCYKYLCLAYRDKYKDFRKLYKSVDLSVINNGEFLSDLTALNTDISEYVKEAKLLELKNLPDNQIYDTYQKAYNLSADMGNLIDNTLKHCDRALLSARIKTVRDWVFGLITIAAFVFAIIVYLLNG